METSDLIQISRVRTLAQTGEARRIREAALVSVGEVAAAVGTSVMNVSRYERGLRLPRGATALRYGEVLSQLESQ